MIAPSDGNIKFSFCPLLKGPQIANIKSQHNSPNDTRRPDLECLCGEKQDQLQTCFSPIAALIVVTIHDWVSIMMFWSRSVIEMRPAFQPQ